MNLRLRTAALLLFVTPVMAACGEDPVHDYSDRGTVVKPGADTSASPTDSSSEATPTRGIDLVKGTIDRSLFSREQTQLFADMAVYEKVAAKQVSEKEPTSAGGSVGTFSDDGDSDFATAKPEGIQVATAYELQWAGGKVVGYSLTTESGERMSFKDGDLFVDTPVPVAQDQNLLDAMGSLRVAIEAWATKHGSNPAVASEGGDVVLKTDLFSDDDNDFVVDLPEGVSYGGYGQANDQYEVTLHADSTREQVKITGKGITVTRSLRVI